MSHFFLYAPTKVVKKTFEATTQFAKHVISKVGPHLHKTYKSPNPAANVRRRNEKVAMDLIYANVPAVDNGSLQAWLCWLNRAYEQAGQMYRQ